MRTVLANCCKHAYAYCVEEPTDLILVDNNQHRKRPDIVTSLNVNNVSTDFALDLTIVSPFVGVRSGNLEISGSSRTNSDFEANEAAKRKTEKYGAICENSLKMKFLPFVMYTTGTIHSTAKQFLNNLAKQGAERRQISERILYNFYLKMLSCCLVKRIGYIITTKANAVISHDCGNNLIQTFRQGQERALDIGSLSAD